MPARELPSYSSSRVQRASRLNALEQGRLQQKLMLLEKAKLHQARLTNQDIRLTSIALDYIVNCSGHSPEGRGPLGEQGGLDLSQQDDPCFLYGERVVSRKVRRMPRPQSAVEQSTFRRHGIQDSQSNVTSGEENSVSGLPLRPQSSPAKGRPWRWAKVEEEPSNEGSDVSSEKTFSKAGSNTPVFSRPSTPGRESRGTPGCGRMMPHQAWEDVTDDVTKRILKAQLLQQQKEQSQQLNSRRCSLSVPDTSRKRSQISQALNAFPKELKTQSNQQFPSVATPMISPRVPSPGTSPTPIIEDRKPISPRQKRAMSGNSLGKRAGFTEILCQARATLSASDWRAHLASTQTLPRSVQSQRQVILEARRKAEKQRQEYVKDRLETFMEQLNDA